MPEIKRVGVLGCGLMGSGIVEICARAGYETWVREVTNDLVAEGARATSRRAWAARSKRASSRGDERSAVLGRIQTATDLEALKNCDLIIEAVTEDLQLKNDMFRTLDRVCPAHTIFASNTSSLTIAEMAAATQRPDRVVGLHFFNPVPVMKLVEVVRTIATSEEALRAAHSSSRVHWARSRSKPKILPASS